MTNELAKKTQEPEVVKEFSHISPNCIDMHNASLKFMDSLEWKIRQKALKEFIESVFANRPMYAPEINEELLGILLRFTLDESYRWACPYKDIEL